MCRCCKLLQNSTVSVNLFSWIEKIATCVAAWKRKGYAEKEREREISNKAWHLVVIVPLQKPRVDGQKNVWNSRLLVWNLSEARRFFVSVTTVTSLPLHLAANRSSGLLNVLAAERERAQRNKKRRREHRAIEKEIEREIINREETRDD